MVPAAAVLEREPSQRGFDLAPIAAGGNQVGRAQKLGHKAVARFGVDLLGGSNLLNLAPLQHTDAVTHGHGLVLVVRDQHEGGPQPLLQSP